MSKVKAEEQFVVDPTGRRTAVVLPIKQYERSMADTHDLAVVAERRSEKPVSTDAMKKRLKKNGLV